MSQPATTTASDRRTSSSAEDFTAPDAVVSEQAHQLWHDFAAANGVSISALVEVLTSVAAPGEPSTDPSDLSLVIMQARQIDNLRRRGNAG